MGKRKHCLSVYYRTVSIERKLIRTGVLMCLSNKNLGYKLEELKAINHFFMG